MYTQWDSDIRGGLYPEVSCDIDDGIIRRFF